MFSSAAVLTVASGGPGIVDQPDNIQRCALGGGSLVVGAAGDGPFTYRWQIQIPAMPANWINVVEGVNTVAGAPVFVAAGAAGAMVTIGQVGATGGASASLIFRCAVMNGCGSATSGQAAFIVCPADFNCSDSISVQDIFDYLTAYFAGAAGADFNGSGAPSVQDIFDFLGAFFGGCA